MGSQEFRFSLDKLPWTNCLPLFFLPAAELVVAHRIHELVKGMTLLVYCIGVCLMLLNVSTSNLFIY